jgi:hypothetical protein
MTMTLVPLNVMSEALEQLPFKPTFERQLYAEVASFMTRENDFLTCLAAVDKRLRQVAEQFKKSLS